MSTDSIITQAETSRSFQLLTAKHNVKVWPREVGTPTVVLATQHEEQLKLLRRRRRNSNASIKSTGGLSFLNSSKGNLMDGKDSVTFDHCSMFIDAQLPLLPLNMDGR